MKDGKILYYGDLEELKGMQRYVLHYKLDGVEKTFATNDVDALNEFLKEIVPKGRIIKIEVDTPRLEDIYFSLIR